MTDRELLEFAAKVAGYGPPTWSELDNRWVAGIDGSAKHWNPLTDDGDALRLAVKLRMNVNIYTTRTAVSAEEFFDDVFHTDDPYAATRRAIVRAAAEIGKAMP